jgi:hypothetical protein
MNIIYAKTGDKITMGIKLNKQKYKIGINKNNILDANRIALPLLFMAISLMGIVGLDLINVPQGTLYANLTYASISFLVLIQFFIKDDEEGPILYPFAKSVTQGIVFFWMGVFTILFFNIISPKQSYTIIKPFALLSATDSSVLGTTLSVVNVQIDVFWQWFLTVWVAGTLEAWIFGFITMAIGMLVGYTLRFMWNSANDNKTAHNHWFDILLGLTLSVFLFVKAHQLNASYVLPIFFIIAGLFRLIVNTALYVFKFVLMYEFGLHMANNASALGWSKTWVALNSGNIIAIIISILIYVSFAFLMYILLFKREKLKELF